MNASTTSSQRPTDGKEKRSTGRGGWIRQHKIASFIMLSVVLLACGAGYLSMTNVTGIELNASTWNVRRFSFRRDPFTNYQFSAIRHQGIAYTPLWTTNDGATSSILDAALSTHLRSNQSTVSRWDLVEIDDSYFSRGPAAPLYELLRTNDSGFSPHWAAWSSKSPKLAAILWPAARDLTELGRYELTPDLLAISCEDLDEAAFKRRVADYIRQAIVDHCKRDDISEEDRKAAAQLGLRYADDPVLQKYL